MAGNEVTPSLDQALRDADNWLRNHRAVTARLQAEIALRRTENDDARSDSADSQNH